MALNHRKGQSSRTPSKFIIFWNFPHVLLGFFDHTKVFFLVLLDISFKNLNLKKVRFQGWLKLAHFQLIEKVRKLSLQPEIIMG